MAVMRWLGLVLSLALAFAAADVSAQTRSSFANPAEYDSYMAALNTRDAAKRATAMEVFIAWYPNSIAQDRSPTSRRSPPGRPPASRPRPTVIAARLLQVDPDNVRALANRAYAGRTRAASGDAAALAPAVAAAERGLAVLPKWQKPVVAHRCRLRARQGADGASLQRHAGLRRAAGQGLRQGATPLPPVGRGRARQSARTSTSSPSRSSRARRSMRWASGTRARAIAIARAAKNDAAANDIDRYVRSRYRVYRGSEEGWNELVARVVAGERAPPDNFVKSIPRMLTPPEAALVLVEDNDPATLSFADWALVLRHRDATPANKAAAEKVWQAIVDKQQGGGTRLKIPVKVISATPDRIEAAITDESQAGNVVDLVVMHGPAAQRRCPPSAPASPSSAC